MPALLTSPFTEPNRPTASATVLAANSASVTLPTTFITRSAGNAARTGPKPLAVEIDGDDVCPEFDRQFGRCLADPLCGAGDDDRPAL